jgi:hypothetical protein
MIIPAAPKDYSAHGERRGCFLLKMANRYCKIENKDL